MIPQPPGWTQILSGPHQRWCVVRPVLTGGTYGPVIPVSDGSITLDGTADVRRTVDLELHDAVWLPTTATDPLMPLGQKLDVRIAMRTPTGVVHELGLGWHHVHEVTVDRPGLTIRVRAHDQAARLAQHLIRGPFAAKRGETADQLIARVLSSHQVAPAVTGVFHAWAGRVASGEWDLGASVWQVVRDTAHSVGCAAWFGRDGMLQVRPRVEDLSTPATIQHRLAVGDGGTLTAYSTTLSRDGAANEIISRIDPAGDKGTAAVWRAAATTGALAVQTAGHMTRVDQTTSPAPSGAAARDRAERRLTAWGGLIRTGTASGVPDHSIEAWDAVEITTMDGVTQRHYVASVTHPLGPDGTSDLTLVSDNTSPTTALSGGW